MTRGGIIGALALGACSDAPAIPAQMETSPSRIVSLDYCADQFVLKLADPEHILAISPDADADFSYMRDASEGVRQVRPVAEDVLALQPDLVVRSYGGGPGASALFARAGVPVLQVGYAASVENVLSITETVAAGLGEAERGAQLATETRARLGALKTQTGDEPTLYMTPSGVTSGSGTLIADLLEQAGLTNYENRPGWHTLPLERLTKERPDRVAAAFYGDAGLSGTSWSSARHPIARQQLTNLPTTRLEGAWTACGGWFLVDALEALTETPRPIEPPL